MHEAASEVKFVSFFFQATATAIGEAKQIYCETSHYERAAASNSATMAARRLIDSVFHPDALATCSISGMPPRGKGKAAYEDPNVIKPHLAPRGIGAIIGELYSFNSQAC